MRWSSSRTAVKRLICGADFAQGPVAENYRHVEVGGRVTRRRCHSRCLIWRSYEWTSLSFICQAACERDKRVVMNPVGSADRIPIQRKIIRLGRCVFDPRSPPSLCSLWPIARHFHSNGTRWEDQFAPLFLLRAYWSIHGPAQPRRQHQKSHFTSPQFHLIVR